MRKVRRGAKVAFNGNPSLCLSQSQMTLCRLASLLVCLSYLSWMAFLQSSLENRLSQGGADSIIVSLSVNVGNFDFITGFTKNSLNQLLSLKEKIKQFNALEPTYPTITANTATSLAMYICNCLVCFRDLK
jgi:hypothetical protein